MFGRGAELLGDHRTDFVVEIFLHARDALVLFADAVIELFDLAGQPPQRIVEFVGALVQRCKARILRLLVLETRGFFFVAFAEKLRHLGPISFRGEGLRFRRANDPLRIAQRQGAARGYPADGSPDWAAAGMLAQRTIATDAEKRAAPVRNHPGPS